MSGHYVHRSILKKAAATMKAYVAAEERDLRALARKGGPLAALARRHLRVMAKARAEGKTLLPTIATMAPASFMSQFRNG